MSVISIHSSSKDYDIIIDKDALAELSFIKTKAIVVVDTLVYEKWRDRINDYLDRANINYHIITVDGGEINKNIDNVLYMYREFNKYGITKSDFVVCIGGGVLGDMTAFASATYLRGVEVVQVPTTLLSMVDSSIGGKSAIDMDFGKNLVGVIKSPYKVLIDITFLETLDIRQFSTGMAEIIKSGILSDREILDECKKDDYDIVKLIERSLHVKGDIVMRDEFETGDRMLLNLGHTVAHAIEALGYYKRYTHGEAVSIGTYIALRLSRIVYGLSDETIEMVKGLFDKFNLPISHDYTVDEVLSYIATDKKMRGNVINFILVRDIEDPIIHKFTLDELREYLNKL